MSVLCCVTAEHDPAPLCQAAGQQPDAAQPARGVDRGAAHLPAGAQPRFVAQEAGRRQPRPGNHQGHHRIGQDLRSARRGRQREVSLRFRFVFVLPVVC
jgi:hypothetical protein